MVIVLISLKRTAYPLNFKNKLVIYFGLTIITQFKSSFFMILLMNPQIFEMFILRHLLILVSLSLTMGCLLFGLFKLSQNFKIRDLVLFFISGFFYLINILFNSYRGFLNYYRQFQDEISNYHYSQYEVRHFIFYLTITIIISVVTLIYFILYVQKINLMDQTKKMIIVVSSVIVVMIITYMTYDSVHLINTYLNNYISTMSFTTRQPFDLIKLILDEILVFFIAFVPLKLISLLKVDYNN